MKNKNVHGVRRDIPILETKGRGVHGVCVKSFYGVPVSLPSNTSTPHNMSHFQEMTALLALGVQQAAVEYIRTSQYGFRPD